MPLAASVHPGGVRPRRRQRGGGLGFRVPGTRPPVQVVGLRFGFGVLGSWFRI